MDGVAINWTPWLALAALGAFHGINPAMGWRFAVALGLHRRSGTAVAASLAPIALGHAVSVAAVVTAVVFAGLFVDRDLISRAGGIVLIAWALWHALYGHRRRVRIGMQTGLVGLALWSFLMASAHGAGLMLVPIVLPLCSPSAIGALAANASIPTALAAVGVHTGTMLAVIAAIAAIVYRLTGVAFLRQSWINFDLVWCAALVATGAVLIFV